MTASFIFWFLMLLWLIFSIWGKWPTYSANRYLVVNEILLFALIVLLGWWGPFGTPIK